MILGEYAKLNQFADHDKRVFAGVLSAGNHLSVSDYRNYKKQILILIAQIEYEYAYRGIIFHTILTTILRELD